MNLLFDEVTLCLKPTSPHWLVALPTNSHTHPLAHMLICSYLRCQGLGKLPKPSLSTHTNLNPLSHTPNNINTPPPTTQVLDVKLPFDEAALLETNKPYLLRSLGLQDLNILSAADAAAAEAAKAAGADPTAAAPGQPVVHFTAQEAAAVASS